ncbi:hypothetical protein AB0N31_10755 [Streptomyces sp. NPDC051051]|uniref:hypothetical protein n=1 Tax=Streptomyces sp. NPDC051051 TaxID=3155666 RepID=UPI003413E6B3
MFPGSRWVGSPVRLREVEIALDEKRGNVDDGLVDLDEQLGIGSVTRISRTSTLLRPESWRSSAADRSSAGLTVMALLIFCILAVPADSDEPT